MIRIALIIAWIAINLIGDYALAQTPPDPAQCPPNVKSCKIVVITPDEEETLVGKGMIFDAAAYANRMNFETLVNAWRQKLATSPAGKLPPPPEPKKP